MSFPDTSAPASISAAASFSASSSSVPASAPVSVPAPSSSFPVSADAGSEASVPWPFPSAFPASGSSVLSAVPLSSVFLSPASALLSSPSGVPVSLSLPFSPAASASFPVSFPEVSAASCTVFAVPVSPASARTVIAAPSCSTMMSASRKLNILACHFCLLNIFFPPLLSIFSLTVSLPHIFGITIAQKSVKISKCPPMTVIWPQFLFSRSNNRHWRTLYVFLPNLCYNGR